MLSDKNELTPVAYASSQIKQDNITRFCGKKNMCKVQKKHISLHPANTRRRPSLGQRWASATHSGVRFVYNLM